MPTLYRVREIYFSDEVEDFTPSNLHDVIVSFFQGFVIVARGDDDTDPAWYSAAHVIKLVGVEPYSSIKANNTMRIAAL